MTVPRLVTGRPSETSSAAALLSDPEIQSILSQHETALQAIYTHYAKQVRKDVSQYLLQPPLVCYPVKYYIVKYFFVLLFLS